MGLSVLQQAELARRIGPGRLAWLNCIGGGDRYYTVISYDGAAVRVVPAVRKGYAVDCVSCVQRWRQMYHRVELPATVQPTLLAALALAIRHLADNGETPV